MTKADYPDKYYCVSAGCRKEKHYLHSYEEVMAAYKDDIMMTTELPEVLASAMGDRLYLARICRKRGYGCIYQLCLCYGVMALNRE